MLIESWLAAVDRLVDVGSVPKRDVDGHVHQPPKTSRGSIERHTLYRRVNKEMDHNSGGKWSIKVSQPLLSQCS